MSDHYYRFLSEYRRLAGINEAPENTQRRGRGRNVMPADRPGNTAAPQFIDAGPDLDPRQAEPVSDPIIPVQTTVIPAGNTASTTDSRSAASYLPGRAAQARIDNPPDPRLQDQFARTIADFIPGVGGAASAYDAIQAAKRGDYVDAAINAGVAGLQTFAPGGTASAVRAATAPFRRAAPEVAAGAQAARAAAPVPKGQTAAVAAGVTGVGAAGLELAGSTQADGDQGEAEARAAEAERQQRIRLAGSTQADGDAGEEEARARTQADSALERSRQSQADISIGGYSGGRESEDKVLDKSRAYAAYMATGGYDGGRSTAGTETNQFTDIGQSPTAAAPAAPVPQRYQIGRGDTLSQIAAKSGTSVAELMRLNPQITNPDRISVGQQINIAGAPQSTYAGGVGTVSDTQAKIQAGSYTPDVISQQAAQRAAASPYNMPNAPGSGAPQMLGTMVSGPPTTPPRSAIARGAQQAQSSGSILPRMEPGEFTRAVQPSTATSATGTVAAPTQSAIDQGTSQTVASNTTGTTTNSPGGRALRYDSNVTGADAEANRRGMQREIDAARREENARTQNVNTSTPASNSTVPNLNQAGVNAAMANMDRRAEQLRARAAQLPATTTTNPDGSTTTTRGWSGPMTPERKAEIGAQLTQARQELLSNPNTVTNKTVGADGTTTTTKELTTTTDIPPAPLTPPVVPGTATSQGSQIVNKPEDFKESLNRIKSLAGIQ